MARYSGSDSRERAVTWFCQSDPAEIGVSTTFVRDREILYRAFTQEPAEYLEGSLSSPEVQHSLDSMGIPYHNFGVELSSPPRGVVVWSILKEIGAEGLRKRIEMHNDMATLASPQLLHQFEC